MLRQIYIIALALFSLHASSQTKTSNEIVAEGGSKIKIRPDLVTFVFTVEKKDTSETKSIMLLNKEVNGLVESLNEIGFSNKAIKISGYNISSFQNDTGKKTYTATNVLKLEFGLDTKLVDALYMKVQKAELKDLNISFETRISDSLERATRLSLVRSAVEDAKTNANNIAKTLDIKLVGVKQVYKYSPGILERDQMAKFNAPKFARGADTEYNTAFDKLQVEEIEFEEKITVVYEISNQVK
ncbi:MAG: SIMPL domain-containing protein [Bacteroidota bacterium]|nr:SIMPL domain-containing protein [Bacteroidota bacterium]